MNATMFDAMTGGDGDGSGNDLISFLLLFAIALVVNGVI